MASGPLTDEQRQLALELRELDKAMIRAKAAVTAVQDDLDTTTAKLRRTGIRPTRALEILGISGSKYQLSWHRGEALLGGDDADKPRTRSVS